MSTFVHLASVHAPSGSSVRAQLRDPSGNFWDPVALAWVAGAAFWPLPGVDGYADQDARFAASLVLPRCTHDTLLEYVLDGPDGLEVIAEDAFPGSDFQYASTAPTGTSLAALADFKAYAKITGSAEDAELARILGAASALFLSETGLTLADLTTVTTTTTTAVDGTVTTTVTPVPVPLDVSQAVIEQAATWYAQRTRAGVQSETSPVGGSTSYSTRELALTFRMVVDSYRRWGV